MVQTQVPGMGHLPITVRCTSIFYRPTFVGTCQLDTGSTQATCTSIDIRLLLLASQGPVCIVSIVCTEVCFCCSCQRGSIVSCCHQGQSKQWLSGSASLHVSGCRVSAAARACLGSVNWHVCNIGHLNKLITFS